MDFITKTLNRPARIAALGLLSLSLAAPSALADEKINVANPVDLSGVSPAPGTRSPSFATLKVAGDHTTFTATANTGYVFRHWQFLSPANIAGNTSTDNPIEISYDDSIDLLQLRPCFAPTYDVVLNPCEGYWRPDATNKVRVVYGEPYGKLDSPYLAGYSFDGWFTQSSGGEEATESTIVSNVSPHTLYAHWSGIESTLTFDPRGGVFADPGEATRTVAYGSPYGELPAVSMGGYSLVGWFKDPDYSSTQISATSKVDEDSDFIVYAKWIPINYTVAFDGNGATSGSMDQLTNRVYDEPFALPLNDFVRPGSKFLGWNTKADGSGSGYTNCAVVANLTTNKNDVVTLYAQWSESVYRVHFLPGGGSGTMDDQTIPWDVDAALASNAFVRAGYAFVSWRDDAHGTNYLDGATVRNLFADGTTGDLVATWAPVDYTVSFKRGAATAKGEMDDLPCVYDSPTNLPPCTFTNPLGTFIGWSRDPYATAPEFSVEAAVSNLATTAGAVVPLYAVWNSELTDLSRAIGCDTLQLNSTSPDPWTATNYAGEDCLMSGYNNSGNSELSATADGPGTLTFKWCVSGSADPSYPQMAKVATSKGVKIGTSSYPVANNGAATEDVPNISDVTTNVWYEKSFRVPEGTGQSIVWHSGVLPNNPYYGRLFLCKVEWLPDADSNSVYTVHFDPGEGSGSMTDITNYVGVAAMLPSNAFTCADHSFDHWHNPLNNRDYPDGATVVDIAPGGSNTTLIAVWSSPTPPGPPPPGPTPPGPTPPDPPTPATNYWTVVPSIAGWTEGEDPSQPVAEAAFGEVEVTYSSGGATPPTAAGDYYATFAVAATEDWTGLSTNVAFTIEEYVQPFAVHIVRRRPRRSFPRSGRTTAPTTAPPPASMTAGRSRPKATSSPSSSSRPPSCGRGTASPPLPPPPPSRTRPPSPGATPRALAPPTEMSPDSSAPRGTSPSSPSVRRWARTTSPAPGATTRSSAPAPAWA